MAKKVKRPTYAQTQIDKREAFWDKVNDANEKSVKDSKIEQHKKT